MTRPVSAIAEEVQDLICTCGHRTLQHDIFDFEIAPCMVEKCPCAKFTLAKIVLGKVPLADSAET
jgi:hypothetical protein